MSGYIYFFTRCFDRWRLKREHFIWTDNSRTNKRFYNVVTTELQSFTPDKMYNALKFMLNPFVQFKLMQCLKINYFETLDYFVFFHTKKKVSVITCEHLLREMRNKQNWQVIIVYNRIPRIYNEKTVTVKRRDLIFPRLCCRGFKSALM